MLSNVDVGVDKGEVVTIIGPNGAGKSTLIRAILGFCDVYEGSVWVNGVNVTRLPSHRRVAAGVGYVPQGRQVFPDLTVEENLKMGGFLLDSRRLVHERMDNMFELFPRLAERRSVRSGLLSGGEQQMCAMARGLMTDPSILLLDEPTLGLAPVLIEQVVGQIVRMREAGLTMMLVEQNAVMALGICDRAYIVDNGTAGCSEDPMYCYPMATFDVGIWVAKTQTF